MLTVHKYHFDIDGYAGKCQGRPIQPLKVDIQNGTPTLWMLVDTDAQPTNLDIIVTGTGHEVQKGWTYCGTVQDGRFVWHVWIPSKQFGFLIS
jgi:hypothetical protein